MSKFDQIKDQMDQAVNQAVENPAQQPSQPRQARQARTKQVAPEDLTAAMRSVVKSGKQAGASLVDQCFNQSVLEGMDERLEELKNFDIEAIASQAIKAGGRRLQLGGSNVLGDLTSADAWLSDDEDEVQDADAS